MMVNIENLSKSYKEAIHITNHETNQEANQETNHDAKYKANHENCRKAKIKVLC